MASKIELEVIGGNPVRLLLDKVAVGRNPAIFRKGLTNIVLELQADVTTSGSFIKHGRGNAPPLPDVLTSRHGGSGLVGAIAPDLTSLPKVSSLGSDLAYAGVHEDSRRAYLLPTYDKLDRRGRIAGIMIDVINEELVGT